MTDLWISEWPITNYIINRLLTGNKSIDNVTHCVLKRFIEGFSRSIILTGQQSIKASYLDSETEITTAIQLYQYHSFLNTLEYCRNNNESAYDSVKLITFLKNKHTVESINATINELNPYVTKCYLILLTSLLQEDDLDPIVHQLLLELLIACLRKINISFLSYLLDTNKKQESSNYWETLMAINSYLVAYFIFTHYPQRSEETRYYLNRALSDLTIVEEYAAPNSTDKLNVIQAFGNIYSGFAIRSSDELKQLITNLQNRLPQDFIKE